MFIQQKKLNDAEFSQNIDVHIIITRERHLYQAHILNNLHILYIF